MLDQLSDFFREHRAVRDFSITGSLIVCGGLLMGHVMATGLPVNLGGPSMMIAAVKPQVNPAPASSRAIIRSVLDDDVTTGSVNRPQSIILDPCTGEQKLPQR
jgi:hypothetical protein